MDKVTGDLLDNKSSSSSSVRKSKAKPKVSTVSDKQKNVSKLDDSLISDIKVHEDVNKPLKVQIILDGDMLDYVLEYCKRNCDLPKAYAVKILMQRGIEAFKEQ